MAIELVGRNPKPKAVRECALAMAQLLEMGWAREDLDMLEALWWKVRDDDGKVIQSVSGEN